MFFDAPKVKVEKKNKQTNIFLFCFKANLKNCDDN